MTIAAGSTILASDVQAIKDDVDAILTASTASVAGSESTSSSSYTDLSTNGPAVTLTTGTLVLVGVHCAMSSDTAGGVSFMSFAVSGATTAAAANTRAVSAESEGAGQGFRIGSSFLISVTAGSNTFTAKYAATGGTSSFSQRRLFVIPLGD